MLRLRLNNFPNKRRKRLCFRLFDAPMTRLFLGRVVTAPILGLRSRETGLEFYVTIHRKRNGLRSMTAAFALFGRGGFPISAGFASDGASDDSRHI